MSGADLAARYLDLGGTADATASTRRRGAPSTQGPAELPLDAEFVDDLAGPQPLLHAGRLSVHEN